MELESFVHQNNEMGAFEGLEDSTYSFGSRFLPEKFQDIDFTLNYKIQNSRISPEMGRKNFLVFSNSKTAGDEESGEKEIESLLDGKVKKMETSFPGSEDFFPWPNEFKMEKCNGGVRSPGIIKPNDGSFEIENQDATGTKRKFWELNLGRKFESPDAEKERKKLKKPENPEDDRRLNSKIREAAGSKMPPWHVDVIEDMAADLDGSLSNLGADLAAGSYNMSEALLSLPSLTVFKQEAPSPSQENLINPPNLQQNVDESHDQNSTLHRLLQQNNFHLKRNNSNGKDVTEKKNEDCRFQYVLAAATSIATKVTEETLTYLNQGQSYEIKLKKVGELSNFRGKILKSIIRICFHERRLQYMEKQQILAWQASRPGERIIELDVPLSYGLFDVEQDPNMLNMMSFLWDPTKEVGAYIKVNCISTEFTPKKHGGEKGVPFRIQVETFIEGETTRLHAAACQIKVFKLKGADRKHKQDREKILKRPPSEQDKYQPSYECTVLSDLPPEAVFPVPVPLNSPTVAPGPGTAPLRGNSIYSPVESRKRTTYNRHLSLGGKMFVLVETITVDVNDVEVSMRLYQTVKPVLEEGRRIRFQVLDRRIEKGFRRKWRRRNFWKRSFPPVVKRVWEAFKVEGCFGGHLRNSVGSPGKIDGSILSESGIEKRRSPAPMVDGTASPIIQLSPESNSQQTTQWLRKNGFGNHVTTFGNFSGADILRLTRDDLIQICGLADGIRLLYALHSKAIVRLTLYICTPSSGVYHALYLDHMGRNEMFRKLAKLLGVPQNQIQDVFLQGPNDIRVLVTDEVISNIKDEAMFSMEVLKDETRGKFILLLKPTPASST